MVRAADNKVGVDCSFEMDDFNKPRIKKEAELIKNCVMVILFMKPGQYPSLPYLGMDLPSRLYSFYDELNERDFENELITQCQVLNRYIRTGDIQVKKMKYRNMPSLLIYVSTSNSDTSIQQYVNYAKKEKNVEFYIGISVNELHEVLQTMNMIEI